MKRAIISVSNKEGVVPFAQELVKLGFEIISTGGTRKALEAAGVKTIGISEVTGFPEIMDGRVKTLHPKVHGGLLSVRTNPEHVKEMETNGIAPISSAERAIRAIYTFFTGFPSFLIDFFMKRVKITKF